MSAFVSELIRWPVSPDYRKIPYRAHADVVPWPQPEMTVRSRRDLSGRIAYALNVLDSVVVVDPETRGGVPVLIGTRVPIARLFAEVAAGRTIADIAEDKELDIESVRLVFKGFAAYMGRSFTT